MGEKIDISLNAMEKRVPSFYKAHEENTCKSYKLVTYIDSSSCSPCGIDHLFDWEQFINEVNEKKDSLSFIFIVAPRKTQLEQTYYAIAHSSLSNAIYVDTSYVFRANNPCMKKGYIFGSFLLDKNNKVILVGNPLDNPKIHNLILNIIRPK